MLTPLKKGLGGPRIAECADILQKGELAIPHSRFRSCLGLMFGSSCLS